MLPVEGRAEFGDLQGNFFAHGPGAMQSNLSQFQRRQFIILTRVSSFSITGHLVNTAVADLALAGSVPQTQLIIWSIYSYGIALLLLYRHLKNRGRSPRNFQR